MQLIGDNLICRRGGRTVFSGLNFTVSSGEAMMVVGRNGAGKSSLLRMIAGLICIYEGRLALSGGENEISLSEQAHYLGHLDALKPSLSVIENLRFWADYLGGTEADIEPALETVDLTRLADLLAGYLSAGQRRRLSIARLVADQRPVWLLDEPTSMLTPQGVADLGRMMRRLKEKGVALILGVDTVMDMARTSVNLLGNCLATAVVARWEGVDLSIAPPVIADIPVPESPATN